MSAAQAPVACCPFGALPWKLTAGGQAAPPALCCPGQAWETDMSLVPVPGSTSPTGIKSIVTPGWGKGHLTGQKGGAAQSRV